MCSTRWAIRRTRFAGCSKSLPAILSNPEPRDYESPALTVVLQAREEGGGILAASAVVRFARWVRWDDSAHPCAPPVGPSGERDSPDVQNRSRRFCRTQNQGIRCISMFPPGADSLHPRPQAVGRVRGALACDQELSDRSIQLPGSLCTFRRCIAGLAQDRHGPAAEAFPEFTPFTSRLSLRRHHLLMSPLH